MKSRKKTRRKTQAPATTPPPEPLHGYPRPQFAREDWTSLDGPWAFAIDAEGRWTAPGQFEPAGTIVVPFAPETPASGVGDTGFFRAVWYRREIQTPTLGDGERLILHFGAVDYRARVWVNDALAVEHEGGYTPFRADVTDLLHPATGAGNTLTVRAEDDPQDLAKPRGKQDWKLDPHAIWYPRTTGIWQTVWLERVPATWIDRARWTPNVERWEIGFEARLEGRRLDDLTLNVRLTHEGRLLADDSYAVPSGELHRKIALPDPGIDDARNDLLWFPWSPRLIDATIELRDPAGRVLDRLVSYTAMRSVSTQGDRFILNGRPLQLQLVLDQGYWRESGLTPPDDGALRRDVELVKAMGFNGVRKHQKIEDPRFLFWADKLGLLVWEEMPSPYRFTGDSVRRLTAEWTAAVERDASHPCVIAWVPFNESWGVPDLPEIPAQRHWVRAIYHLTKTLDPTRPVIGNDGWEAVATDVIAIHDYHASPERLTQRYGGAAEAIPRLLKSERPGFKNLLLDDFAYAGNPIMLTEFGGIAYSKDQGSWGYSRAESADLFAAKYAALLGAVRAMPILSGFCYTQFTDTYQEANGLLTMERVPKFPIEQIAVATRGARSEPDRRIEAGWQRRLRQQRDVEREALEAGDA